MSLYCNVPLRILHTRNSYSSGYITRRGRILQTHTEAPLSVSQGIIRNFGVTDLDGDRIHDDFTIMDSEYSGKTLSARKKRKDCAYAAMDLILYTIPSKMDLSRRKDAVLMRNCDKNRVEVISGGGYYNNGKRRYDNIVLKIRCDHSASIIAVQLNGENEQLSFGDYLYIVDGSGVEQVRIGFGNNPEELSQSIPMDLSDWTRI